MSKNKPNPSPEPEAGSLPLDHELPLATDSSKILRKKPEGASESTVREITKENRSFVLKEVIETKFADHEEMVRNKAFYDYIKNYPGLGKHVPDTLYFKARIKPGDEPQAFRVQPLIDGTPLDEMTDEELYANPEVVRQLLEVVEAANNLLNEPDSKEKPRLDLMRTPGPASFRVTMGGLLANPRYTSNILVAKEPDELGRYIFFVDTAGNADERSGSARGKIQRLISSPPQKLWLKRWKKQLEKLMNEKEEEKKDGQTE